MILSQNDASTFAFQRITVLFMPEARVALIGFMFTPVAKETSESPGIPVIGKTRCPHVFRCSSMCCLWPFELLIIKCTVDLLSVDLLRCTGNSHSLCFKKRRNIQFQVNLSLFHSKTKNLVPTLSSAPVKSHVTFRAELRG